MKVSVLKKAVKLFRVRVTYVAHDDMGFVQVSRVVVVEVNLDEIKEYPTIEGLHGEVTRQAMTHFVRQGVLYSHFVGVCIEDETALLNVV